MANECGRMHTIIITDPYYVMYTAIMCITYWLGKAI
ncbi:uncharacterized protein METZ01_LOCUS372402, partial [marine metagenome]